MGPTGNSVTRGTRAGSLPTEGPELARLDGRWPVKPSADDGRSAHEGGHRDRHRGRSGTSGSCADTTGGNALTAYRFTSDVDNLERPWRKIAQEADEVVVVMEPTRNA